MKNNCVVLTEDDVVRVDWPKGYRIVRMGDRICDRWQYKDYGPYYAKFHTKLLIHDNSSDKTQIKFIGKTTTIQCDVFYSGFIDSSGVHEYISSGEVTITNNKKPVEQVVKVKTTLEIIIPNNPDDYDSVSINGVYFVRCDDE